jgi:hypothetical protein
MPIILRCPRCRIEKEVPRDNSLDPPEATVGESLCEKCIDETNAREPECYYYDSYGNPVLDLFDPDRISNVQKE